jgi:hypothetical protein
MGEVEWCKVYLRRFGFEKIKKKGGNVYRVSFSW